MNSDESNFGRYENSENKDLPYDDRVCRFDKEKAYEPLCNYHKFLNDKDMINKATITGTALLLNRTNLVIIDVDNKGKSVDECKEIFERICKQFLPSPD